MQGFIKISLKADFKITADKYRKETNQQINENGKVNIRPHDSFTLNKLSYYKAKNGKNAKTFNYAFRYGQLKGDNIQGKQNRLV